MTQPAITGTATAHIPGGGGGEGPWIVSDYSGNVTVDGAAGDKWVLWADSPGDHPGTPPTLSGPIAYQGSPSYPYGDHVWIVCFVGDGTGTVSSGSCPYYAFLMHRLPLLYIGDLSTPSLYCD